MEDSASFFSFLRVHLHSRSIRNEGTPFSSVLKNKSRELIRNDGNLGEGYPLHRTRGTSRGNMKFVKLFFFLLRQTTENSPGFLNCASIVFLLKKCRYIRGYHRNRTKRFREGDPCGRSRLSSFFLISIRIFREELLLCIRKKSRLSPF